jgi:hypothetical protein
MEGIGRIVIQTYPKITKAKKDWGHVSSGRTPA